MELVQEIHQVLMDREDTCIRTCFSLQIDGVTLDNFAELKSIEGLKEGSVIKVVEGRLLQSYLNFYGVEVFKKIFKVFYVIFFWNLCM